MSNPKRSSRHPKITGNFAENLVLYLLSKDGFECANIDHTGIDIIARHPRKKEVWGISVKGRSRGEGKEGSVLAIPNKNFDKMRTACNAFDCKPYFALVVDGAGKIHVFVLPKAHLLKLTKKRKGKQAGWKMNKKWVERYYKDAKIQKYTFHYGDVNP